MPKGDTWPGGVAIQSLTNMDSAGSCDSVISMNSGYSEDSMEYLSPEERACIMYLEETIEALEVQEDSGLSNDEPDSVARMTVNGITNSKPGEFDEGQISNKAGIPALNQASEPHFSPDSTHLKPSPPTETNSGGEIDQPAPRTTELVVTKDEDGHLKIVPSNSLSPDPPTKAPDTNVALIPPPSDFMDKPQPRPQLEKAKVLPSPAGISNNKPRGTIDLEQLRQRAAAKRHSMSPPDPSDKHHEPSTLAVDTQRTTLDVSPGPPLLPVSPGPPTLDVSPAPAALPVSPDPPPITLSPGPPNIPPPPPPSEAFEPRGPPVMAVDPGPPLIIPPPPSEAFEPRGPQVMAVDPGPPLIPPPPPPSEAFEPRGPPVMAVDPGPPLIPPPPPPSEAFEPRGPPVMAVDPGPPLIPPPPPSEAFEPRSPPAVAPKPKKLPANIILKSHKTAVADGNSGPSTPTSGDRLLSDRERVHMEALRKLGLLKSEDSDPGLSPSPRLSPQTRRSWAAPSSPLSPRTPSTLSFPRVHSSSSASVPLQSPASAPFQSPAPISLQSPAAGSPSVTLTAPPVQPPEILPAPDAFSDPEVSSLNSDYELSAGNNSSDATPPLTPPVLVKQLTPPKFLGVKSATLERSGPGLSSYMASQDPDVASISGKLSPSQLRNNRPRPASLGSRKEFSSAQGDGAAVAGAAIKEPSERRSLPPPQPSANSQKLPRSEGISVMICPRAENRDGRREALRKLGLIRD